MSIIYDAQWDVPSDSNSGKTYKVSLKDGVYSCSCPAWTRHAPRKDCKHIIRVVGGWYDKVDFQKKLPNLIYAQVEQLTWEGDNLLVPLIPFDDGWFQATLVYDLACAGIPWYQIAEKYDIAKRNSRTKINAYIQQRGRRVYKFVPNSMHHGYQVLPFDSELPRVEETQEEV